MESAGLRMRIRNAAAIFLRPSVCLSARKVATTTEQIILKFGICDF
jgi:hypothetical protein